jgi:hypothetical protein
MRGVLVESAVARARDGSSFSYLLGPAGARGTRFQLVAVADHVADHDHVNDRDHVRSRRRLRLGPVGVGVGVDVVVVVDLNVNGDGDGDGECASLSPVCERGRATQNARSPGPGRPPPTPTLPRERGREPLRRRRFSRGGGPCVGRAVSRDHGQARWHSVARMPTRNTRTTSALVLALASFLLLGCASAGGIATLRPRAAFDMSCEPNELEFYEFPGDHVGVRGCGRRATYRAMCASGPFPSRGNCAWVVATAPAEEPTFGLGNCRD